MRISEWSSDVCSSDLIGHVGTQLDGFTHQSHRNSLYNCFEIDEISTRSGFEKLGIDKVGMLMGRGVLIDVAGLKGVEMLPDNYEITVEDLEAALKKQGTTIEPGDAVVIHTGWGKLWARSEEHTSELQSLMRISYAVFCLKKKNK